MITADCEAVLESALKLPDEDRALIAQRLIESLPDDGDLLEHLDAELRREWMDECRRRWDAYKRGEMKAVDGEAVFQRIRARYES